MRRIAFIKNRIAFKVLRGGGFDVIPISLGLLRLVKSQGFAFLDAFLGQSVLGIDLVDPLPVFECLFVLVGRFQHRRTAPQELRVGRVLFGDSLVKEKRSRPVVHPQTRGRGGCVDLNVPRIDAGGLFRDLEQVCPVPRSVHHLDLSLQLDQLQLDELRRNVARRDGLTLHVPQSTPHLSRLRSQFQCLAQQLEGFVDISALDCFFGLSKARNRRDADFIWTHSPTQT